MRSFKSATNPTDLVNYFGKLSQNNSAANLALGETMINDAHRYLLQKYFFNESSHTIVTVAQQQEYNLPYNYSKLKTGTLTIGDLRWNPTEILTRREWDDLNVFPYYADYPNYFYIYGGKFNLWPIPSSSGKTITFNYQKRVPNLTFTDYTTGTIAATNNSTTLTGTTTTWLSNYIVTAGSVLNLNLWVKITSPKGDDNWYQISSIASDTSLTLLNPYEGSTTTGASYTIGQMPLLLEDFHDLLVYRPLMIYYSTIQPNQEKAAEFKALYQEGIKALDDYAGTKSLNVNLGQRPQMLNPNLFWQG